MSKYPSKLVIATRASRLALWQAEHVQARLQALYPECEVSLLKMTTRGDQILDRTLSKVGGKGLFVKELETALLDGRADIAVHSLKDVPVDLTTPFSLPVIMERDDPRDAFVSSGYASLEELPEGAVVGTSSLRRESQIRARFPKLKVKPLRGNLDTRLGKLDRGEYDAIVLAAAGLRRLGLQNRIRGLLEPEISLPSAGQGALGIEILESRSDLAEWLQPLSCPETTACAIAERAVSRVLGGSCQVPLAAFAQVSGSQLTVQALVAEPDGTKIIRSHRSGEASDALHLGEAAARELLAQGADAILARLLPPTA
ncbi:hydroxymethylbilane synthase [Achromobacter sp. F4_2707]|uniref:hydroxymethylbilane synthase n=1 Tax=Achromobacter sp. F4_2707 TaxID=3114286 RepID=UPI0039C66179